MSPKEEKEEVTFSSSSSSSDYEDSEDEYKNESWKKSSRSRTLRKRAVKMEKFDATAKSSTVRPKKRRKKQDFGNIDASTETYSTNTFIYFENINSVQVEEVDHELKHNLEEEECVGGRDNCEVNMFPQNENSEKVTEQLLTKLLEQRSENITESTAQITHLPCNPFSEKIAGFRSVTTINGRCQSIIQTYHPDIFKSEKPMTSEGVPSFVIWNQPFEYLIHQKNVLDVNENVKSIVQRKVDEQLDIRKQYLMNEIIEKANDIAKRDISISNQNFPTYCGPEHLNYYECKIEGEYVDNDRVEAGLQETDQNAEIEDDEQYSDPFQSKPLFEELKPKDEDDLDIYVLEDSLLYRNKKKMHPPQIAKCMNQECQKKCTMRRGPAYLECSHFFCTQCYNKPGFDRSCRLCSPQILQPKTSKSNDKKLVGRKDLESTGKAKHCVQKLETLEEEDDTAQEEGSKICAEDIFTVEKYFGDGNSITKVENESNSTKGNEILDNTDLEEHTKGYFIYEEEKRKKIKRIYNVDTQIRKLANLDLNLPSDFIIHTDLGVKSLKINKVHKYLRKCESSKFVEQCEKIEKIVDFLNAKKDICEEEIRKFAGSFITSFHLMDKESKTTMEIDANETEHTDYKKWKLDYFVAKMSEFPEPMRELEDVKKKYHEKSEALKKQEMMRPVINTFKTPTRSKLLGPPFGGGNWKVETPIIKKPVLVNQSPAVTPNDALEKMITIPTKEKRTQKTWREELYTKDDPQPQSELEKHLTEVNWCLSQRYKKDLSSKDKRKEECLMIIGKLIGNMTIYENCRQAAIETFENTFNVKLPIIETVQ